MKISVKDFFCKCHQIRSFLWIWSYLLEKSLMRYFDFCAVLEEMLGPLFLLLYNISKCFEGLHLTIFY